MECFLPATELVPLNHIRFTLSLAPLIITGANADCLTLFDVDKDFDLFLRFHGLSLLQFGLFHGYIHGVVVKHRDRNATAAEVLSGVAPSSGVHPSPALGVVPHLRGVVPTEHLTVQRAVTVTDSGVTGV